MRTPEDEEFLMATAGIVEMWRQLAVQEGVVQGLKQGLVEGLKQGLDEGRKEGLDAGRKEGRKEGREEGREEGRTQERQASLARERRLLLRLLNERFGDVDIAIEERVEAASADQVETWLDHVLSAATPAQVLAH